MADSFSFKTRPTHLISNRKQDPPQNMVGIISSLANAREGEANNSGRNDYTVLQIDTDRHSHLQQGFQGPPVLLEPRVVESAYDLYDHEQGGVR